MKTIDEKTALLYFIIGLMIAMAVGSALGIRDRFREVDAALERIEEKLEAYKE